LLKVRSLYWILESSFCWVFFWC